VGPQAHVRPQGATWQHLPARAPQWSGDCCR
jgi:hypothetical protein